MHLGKLKLHFLAQAYLLDKPPDNRIVLYRNGLTQVKQLSNRHAVAAAASHRHHVFTVRIVNTLTCLA